MNIILTAINAKFIHSNPAIRSLWAYCRNYREHLILKEYNINQDTGYIISELYAAKPDVLCLSCYIWNIRTVREIISVFKTVRPEMPIVLGGPEATYDYENLLACGADIVVTGEGESAFDGLCRYFTTGGRLGDIAGIAYVQDGKVFFTGESMPLPPDEIPFIYDKATLGEYDNRIVYYESSRGCPFNCGYCLSSINPGVRFLGDSRLYSDLDFFIQNKIPLVKFVDRTFNADKARANAVWEYLTDNDNGSTRFHFELAGDLLDESALTVLRRARKGLFQFEIGVQSVNENTLGLVNRIQNTGDILKNAAVLMSQGNIHVHMDLIAGLPGEDFASFADSFNKVFEVKPDMLQLGFLKLLKGSPLSLKSDSLGLKHNPAPPYEILSTPDLSFDEILKLKRLERVFRIFYSSGKLTEQMDALIPAYKTPFDCFMALGDYWYEKGYHHAPRKASDLPGILRDFSEGL